MKFLTTTKRDALTLTAPGPSGKGTLSVTLPVRARTIELTSDQIALFGACLDSLIANGVILPSSPEAA